MKAWQKWALIIAVVIGILVAVKSCVDKREPDITLAYIGDNFIDRSMYDENVDCLHSVCRDVNSDGEIHVDIMEISYNESLGQSDRQNADGKLMNAIGYGAARVYFIEEKYAMKNASGGFFADISHLGEGFKNADGQTVAISIKDNEKAESLGIDTSGEIYLAVRVISEVDNITDKNINAKHSLAMDIAEYILN
ncbi:MAG: hypothetical protein IKU60_03190 [Clostridia bacterium]|nr:hypothetical protein [Clostridia bacterium]